MVIRKAVRLTAFLFRACINSRSTFQISKKTRKIAKKRGGAVGEIIEYTDEEFRHDCRRLAEMLIQDKVEIDVIVGIHGSRAGGLFLMAQMAEITNIDCVYSISYASNTTNGERELKNILQIHPRIAGKKLLACTEVTDTGTTIRRAKIDLVMHKNYITTIALHCRKGGIFRPDYFANEIGEEFVV